MGGSGVAIEGRPLRRLRQVAIAGGRIGGSCSGKSRATAWAAQAVAIVGRPLGRLR